ncbi:hypothetical protein RB195_000726 [Necator americanus]|uniref:Uncharacterized protein n=1 Tax=Necator americanus TaxID=51031 RepID=A0ABR1DCT3_NECAM
MNGVVTLEQRQQPATSTADWTRAPLPSGLVRSLRKRRHSFRKEAPIGTPHTVEDSAILDAVKEDPEINTLQSCEETWM